MSSAIKEEEIANFPGRKSSPALAETGLRATVKVGLPSQPTSNILPTSGNTVSSNESLGTIPLGSEMGKRNILVSDDRSGSSGIAQSLVSPLGSRVIVPQAAKASDGLGSADPGNFSDAAIMGSRVFTSPVVPGMQWRPGSSFQNQNEAVCYIGVSLYCYQFTFFSVSFVFPWTQDEVRTGDFLSSPLPIVIVIFA